MTHCGYCAIIGAPNAGKSTLTNALVGSKEAKRSPRKSGTAADIPLPWAP